MYLCTLWMEGELYQPPLSVSPFFIYENAKDRIHSDNKKK